MHVVGGVLPEGSYVYATCNLACEVLLGGVFVCVCVFGGVAGCSCHLVVVGRLLPGNSDVCML